MNCPNCGKKLTDEDARFCTGCGAGLDAAAFGAPRAGTSGPELPSGVKQGLDDTDIVALGRALVIGVAVGLAGGAVLTALFTKDNAVGVVANALLFAILLGLGLMAWAARASREGRLKMEKWLPFIPVKGGFYRMVDVVATMIPFLNPVEMKRRGR